MTDKTNRIKEIIKKHTKANTATKELAMQHLIKIGVHNKDGTLHKNYGG